MSCSRVKWDGKNDDDGKKLKMTEALYMYRELI
jgi:hypothetical protein